MNPLKAKQLLPEIAQELNQDLQLVEDISEFFWDYTHKHLVAMSHTHIQIQHLGTFNIRRKIILKLREKLAKRISRTPPTTFQRYAIHKDTQEKVKQIDLLLRAQEKEFSAKKDFRIKRNARKFQQAVEEQEKDPGGDW